MEGNQSKLLGQCDVICDPTSDNFDLLSTHPSRLEVIREEELSECSDSEYAHIESANDPTARPSPVNNEVYGANGDKNTVEHVSTKFNPANTLRQFIKHRRQRKRRRGIPHQDATIRFEQKEHQIQTTCMLVDTRESDMAPAEYRSICTTETVHNEIMQAEVINIGSNSSSLDDLSDLDSENREKTPEQNDQKQVNTRGCEEFIVHMGAEQPTGPPICEPNDCTQNLTISGIRCLQYDDVLSYSEDSATHAQPANFQPNQKQGRDDDISNDCTLSGGVRDVLGEHGNAERTIFKAFNNTVQNMSEYSNTLESANLDSTVAAKNLSSLGVSSSSVVVVGRDCASAVVGNNHKAITALKDPPFLAIDCDRASKFGIDSTVNHCVPDAETSSLVEKNMYPSEENSTVTTVVKKEHKTATPPPPPIPQPRVVAKAAIPLPSSPVYENANVTNLGQHPTVSAEISKPDTLPYAQLVPLTVEALSSSTTGSCSIEKNAQTHSSDHSSKSDHADANQISTEDCVDAVTSPERQDLLNSSCDDQSVLLKLIQEERSTASSSESRHQGKIDNLCQASPVIQAQSDCTVADLTRNQADYGRNSDREPKIEQRGEDHGGPKLCASYEETIVRLPSHSHGTSEEIITVRSKTGINNTSVRHPNSTYGEISKLSHENAESFNIAKDSCTSLLQEAKTSNMRTEISCLKDAELQEEFRKLEIETARFESELQQITVPSQQSESARDAEPGNKYFVSKQKDFAIERSSVAHHNNSLMISTDSENRVKGGSVKINDRRERRDLQRSFATNSRECNSTLTPSPGPIPPPPPAPHICAEPTTNSEETFTKKVKDRVRELMASQAAAQEANHVIKLHGGGFASAPSTPTASRKNIEAEFKEFREIRQREAIADRKLSESTTAPSNTYASTKQQPAHTGESAERQDETNSSMRNYSPSRIPLATTKISFVSRNQTNDVQGAARAGELTDSENVEKLKDINSAEIKVNVAALIATHQEKQLQNTAPSAAQPSKVSSTLDREYVDHNSINYVPNDESSSEPLVSVSDKCQQFEQRIRKNSMDSSVNTITHRKTNTSTSLDEAQQKPGTTNGIYAEVYSDAVDNGSFSGTDLLHEIDHALVLAKDFLFSREISRHNREKDV
uniref:Uncharacterized protein n=1 Tax=Anopheles christyi TaxID=43041 RepID=A0A182JST0_9DIPT